mgnify:FL=1
MILKVDIAHQGQSSEQALIQLETEISKAKVTTGVVAVKVVHGLGSGTIAKTVRDWAKEQEGRFTAVISGEDYNAFNKEAVAMRSKIQGHKDKDFNNRNAGITIFWL